ncbi:MAG: hypothetical protein H7Y88_03815 [Phycisphaerales bacterium]|nr:hypothetical protein [Phycisphaerales bacterium]
MSRPQPAVKPTVAPPTTPAPSVIIPVDSAPAPTTTEAPAAPVTINDAISAAVSFILKTQEGDTNAEWPYEGVYRVRGEIPIGYRVGGTGICAVALLRAPGYAADRTRQEAVARAVRFVCDSTAHPLMSVDGYAAGYDARGWGYTYGLWFLLAATEPALPEEGSLSPELRDAATRAISHYVGAIEGTQIPECGGWNYARSPGKDTSCPPSPFMTASTLQALFEAKRRGLDVKPETIERALKMLERGRIAGGGGAVTYSISGKASPNDRTPGAVGRMLCTENTLYLAGRGSAEGVRGALDAFIVHWEWLEKRRAKPGTHAGPYAVAPYYFYYAHYFAAQAVELLPEGERAEYRRRVSDLLFRTRAAESGSWNDRVFPRTANYGTAMAVLSMTAADGPAPAAYEGTPLSTPPATGALQPKEDGAALGRP